MSELIAGKILKNPKYLQLVRQRDTFAWVLSAIVCVMYFGFILMIAFAPEILTQPIAADSVIPLGMLMGVGVIVVFLHTDGDLRLSGEPDLRPYRPRNRPGGFQMKIFKNAFFAMLVLASVLTANLAYAADAAVAAVVPAAAAAPAETPLNWHAIVMFLIFVAVTLVITYWAATRTKTATDFYAAGRGITGLQNGLAIAGDYMSAASFLGIAALVYMNGFYGLIFSVGWLVGWPIILFLIAERLRNLGKYTYGDVVSFRLSQGPVRTMAAIGSLIVVIWYLIGQAVGAGQLLHTLVPQMSYQLSIVIVGALIITYVTFGGMKATTWVQIIKATLLLGGATLMAIGVMSHEGFSFAKLFSDAVAAHPKHLDIMKSVVPIGAKANPIESISLGLTLMLGTAGLPHILMRFFTVTDSKAARKSVLYGTCFIGFFYVPDLHHRFRRHRACRQQP